MKEFDAHSNQWTLPYTEHPLARITIHTVINTWIMLGILFCVLMLVRFFLYRRKSMVRHLSLSFVQFFVDLINQSIPHFSFNHFCFIGSAFIFVLFANILSLVPGLEEPTTDLNTTLALALISFLYTQWNIIYMHGLWTYIKGFFSPIFIMLPLNIIGKLAPVISLSFRLFGNIFGGSIITTIYLNAIHGTLLFELIGLFTGINIALTLFFIIFEGFLQAFVFAMLSLTYLSLGLQGEGH